MRSSPTRHRVALTIALTGVAVSAYVLNEHVRLHADGAYVSSCKDLGFHCDEVLRSRWGKLLGLPVPAWSLADFAVGAVLAVPGALGATGAGLADLLLIGLVSASLGYALVLLGVMVFAVQASCIFCLTVDAVILAWFVTVVPLASRFEASPRTPWARRRSTAQVFAAAALVLALAGGATLAAVPNTVGACATAADVRSIEPKFFEMYDGLKRVPLPETLGAATHTKGAPNASVTLVEFSDFECPACGAAFHDLRALVKKHPDLRLVFRHFPLDSSCNRYVQRAVHQDACLAAAASECAGKQDRFWEYHDLLFQNQASLDRDNLFRYARELGLDIPTFRTCLDDPATRDVILQDIEAGRAAGVDSTPTLFTNTRRIDGALEQPFYDYALCIERSAGAGG